MQPSSPSPSPSATGVRRHDSWRSSSGVPTLSPWQQSPVSPPQSRPESRQSQSSGQVRQSPAGLNCLDWNPAQTAGHLSGENQSPSQQSQQSSWQQAQLPWQQTQQSSWQHTQQSPWQRTPPHDLPWSAGVVSQARRANTIAETRSGSGFGGQPALSSHQSQGATLPAAPSSPVRPQMAAPTSHWAAPLSPSGSVTSVDWNHLFETSSEMSR